LLHAATFAEPEKPLAQLAFTSKLSAARLTSSRRYPLTESGAMQMFPQSQPLSLKASPGALQGWTFAAPRYPGLQLAFTSKLSMCIDVSVSS